MGPDASHIAGAIARSVEVDRSPSASQRANEIAQDQLAGESVSQLALRKADAAAQVRREKIRQDRERRRREMERHGFAPREDDDSDDDGALLDVVA